MAGKYGVLSQVVDLSAASTFPTDPQVVSDFVVDCWVFALDGAAGDEFAVSFDGATVHGRLKKGVQLNDLRLEVTHKRVWLKKVTAGGTLNAYVHANAIGVC